MWRWNHVYLDQASDGTAGGGSDGGAGTGITDPNGTGAAGAGSSDGSTSSAAAAPGSVLASAAAAAGSGAGPASGADSGADWIPEKHRVTKADGSLDLEASARKVADAHRHLEQRLGSGDVPPKTPEEYAPTVEADGFNWDELKADPDMQGFLKGAHAKGITNDQLSYVLGEYFKTAPQLVNGAKQMDTEGATAELRKEWKTDAEFQQNVSLALRAFQAFATEADRARIDEIGNNPMVVRMLAAIGKELPEDSAVHGQPLAQADWDTKTHELRQQLATLPTHDPRRQHVMAELNGLYERRYGAAPKQAGSFAVRTSSAT